MYQSDYILRMIEQMGALLRRMLQALRETRPEEALLAADEAVELVAEVPAGLLDALEPEGVVQLMGAGGVLDVPRSVLLAQALFRRGSVLEAAGRSGDAEAQQDKAEALLAAARATDPEAVDELLQALALVARDSGA